MIYKFLIPHFKAGILNRFLDAFNLFKVTCFEIDADEASVDVGVGIGAFVVYTDDVCTLLGNDA